MPPKPPKAAARPCLSATARRRPLYRFLAEGTPRPGGRRAAGWAEWSDGPHTATLSVRDFWQNYPKDLAVDAAGLELGICPAWPGRIPRGQGHHGRAPALLLPAGRRVQAPPGRQQDPRHLAGLPAGRAPDAGGAEPSVVRTRRAPLRAVRRRSGTRAAKAFGGILPPAARGSRRCTRLPSTAAFRVTCRTARRTASTACSTSATGGASASSTGATASTTPSTGSCSSSRAPATCDYFRAGGGGRVAQSRRGYRRTPTAIPCASAASTSMPSAIPATTTRSGPPPARRREGSGRAARLPHGRRPHVHRGPPLLLLPDRRPPVARNRARSIADRYDSLLHPQLRFHQLPRSRAGT